MKFVNQSFEIWNQEPTLLGIFKQIELAGRTCYQSRNLISDESAKPFVNSLISRGHTAPLEHGTVYLSLTKLKDRPDIDDIKAFFMFNPHSTYNIPKGTNHGFVTTNYRVLYENSWLDLLSAQSKTPGTCSDDRRVTVHFTTSRQIANEFVRHRGFSFCQESTRYCNYTTGKFCHELTFIRPDWVNPNLLCPARKRLFGFLSSPPTKEQIFYSTCQDIERNYFRLAEFGWRAEQCASILPNTLKTELVMTGTIAQWRAFFLLRCDRHAHPMARSLSLSLLREFIRLSYMRKPKDIEFDD